MPIGDFPPPEGMIWTDTSGWVPELPKYFQLGEQVVKEAPTPMPIRERHAVTAGMAAEFIGISRTRIYEMLASGELEGKVIHGRRVVLVESLLRMVDNAPTTSRV